MTPFWFPKEKFYEGEKKREKEREKLIVKKDACLTLYTRWWYTWKPKCAFSFNNTAKANSKYLITGKTYHLLRQHKWRLGQCTHVHDALVPAPLSRCVLGVTTNVLASAEALGVGSGSTGELCHGQRIYTFEHDGLNGIDRFPWRNGGKASRT